MVPKDKTTAIFLETLFAQMISWVVKYVGFKKTKLLRSRHEMPSVMQLAVWFGCDIGQRPDAATA